MGPIPPIGTAGRGPATGRFGGAVNQLGGQQNLLGILSTVLGIVSLCCGPCLGFGGSGGLFLFDFIPAIAAIVLGILHLQRINQGQASNRSLAIVGIVLGMVGVIIAICLSASNTGVQWHEDITGADKPAP